MKPLHIRPAAADDAESVSRLLRDSIVALCSADHRDDQAIIANWLRNKKDANVRAWIESSSHVAVLAESGAQVVGFGLMDTAGALLLLYVSPEWRLRTVSKQVLGRLEDHARAQGLREVSLYGTMTAQRFYASAGYTAAGEPLTRADGRVVYPMRKRLDAR